MPRPKKPASPFRYFNSSPEVIRLVVLMYVRFPLSLRNVEDLLFERGIDICHETVRFFKRVLKRHDRPVEIITDGLRSYRAAMVELGCEDRREMGRWLNNRAENSHLPFRRRKRVMQRFPRMKTVRKFSSIHANFHNHFDAQRHLVNRQTFTAARSAALAEWQNLAA